MELDKGSEIQYINGIRSLQFKVHLRRPFDSLIFFHKKIETNLDKLKVQSS